MSTGGQTWIPGATSSSLAAGRRVRGSLPRRALLPRTSGVPTLIRQSRRDVGQHLLGEQLLQRRSLAPPGLSQSQN